MQPGRVRLIGKNMSQKQTTLRGALLLSTTLLIAGLGTSAQAADGPGLYANIGIAQLSADLDLTNLSAQGTTINLGEQSAKITTITGRLGYRVMDFLAIEGEAGFGLGGDSFSQAVPVTVAPVGTVNIDTDVDVDINTYGAVFARGILPVGEQFEVFVRGGYGVAKAEASAVGTVAALPGFSATASASEKANDFAYGVGAQFNMTDRHGIRLDYTGIGDFQIVSVSYAINF